MSSISSRLRSKVPGKSIVKKSSTKNKTSFEKSDFTIVVAICTACDLPIGTSRFESGCETNFKKLGTFGINKQDTFKTILSKLNGFLKGNRLRQVEGFHYLQEDGDMNYASSAAFSKQDLIYSLKYNTKFFVYFDDTCWFKK